MTPSPAARTRRTAAAAILCTGALCAQAPPGFEAVEVLTPDGSGTHAADGVNRVALDAFGNAYVSCSISNNVFRVPAIGPVSRIIGPEGDGLGNTLNGATGIAVDPAGVAYVAGFVSDNVFRITPAGAITQVADASGDGAGNALDIPIGLALDDAGNVFVGCAGSDNAFRISPSGTVTQILGPDGDGAHALDNARGVAVDGQGNAYVVGFLSNNVFRVTPGGQVAQILDGSGDGLGNVLERPMAVAVQSDGTAYVSGRDSDNLFRVGIGGEVEEILDLSGDGTHAFRGPDEHSIAVTENGICFVSGAQSDNVFQVTHELTTQVLDASGDGVSGFEAGHGVALDCDGRVFVAAAASDNVFRIQAETLAEPYGCGVNPGGSLTVLGGTLATGDAITLGLDNPLGTQGPGSLPFLALVKQPDPAYPCGTPLPGLGMGPGSATGELLLGLAPPPFLTLGGPAWAGPLQPAPIPIAVPDDCLLIGVAVFAQGALLDPAPGATHPLALTEGIELRIGP